MRRITNRLICMVVWHRWEVGSALDWTGHHLHGSPGGCLASLNRRAHEHTPIRLPDVPGLRRHL